MPLAEKILAELRRVVGDENVLITPEDLIPYSFDGTAALQQMPGCVVFARYVGGDHRRANPPLRLGSGVRANGGSERCSKTFFEPFAGKLVSTRCPTACPSRRSSRADLVTD